MKKWQEVECIEALKQGDEFKKTLKIAWEFDRIIQKGSSGIGPLTSLIGVRDEPIIYLLMDSENELECWKQENWFACLLSELYPHDGNSIEGFKKLLFALIFSGDHAPTKAAFDYLKKETFDATRHMSLLSEQAIKLFRAVNNIEKIHTPFQSVLLREIVEEHEDGRISELPAFIEEFGNKNRTSPKTIPDYVLEKHWSILG